MAEFVFSAFADEISPDLDTQLESLNKLKIPFIELRGVDGKSFIELNGDELASVREKLDAYNISVWSLGSPLGKAVADEKSRQSQPALLDRIMDIGDTLGVKRIRMFSFYPQEGDSFAEFEAKVFSLIDLLLERAEKRGFTLCHENEKGIYGCSAQRVKALAEHFGGRLKVVLDNGNFPFCGESAHGAYSLLKNYIDYLHIKDCDSDGIIVPPGHGDACIRETLSEINSDRTGRVVLTMEPHLVNFTGLSSLSKLDDIKHSFSFDSPYEAFRFAFESVTDILAAL